MTVEDNLTDSAGGTAGGTEDLRAVAARSLRRKQDFYNDLVAYLVVNGLLIAIWVVIGFVTDFWFPWPLFPLAGWGIGLAMHAYATYGPPSRPITDEAIRQEMRRLERH